MQKILQWERVNASTIFTFTGNKIYDTFGMSVSNVGDINNDGFNDIIIGASMKNEDRGVVYVIYGREKSTLSSIDLSLIALALKGAESLTVQHFYLPQGNLTIFSPPSKGLDPLTTGFIITGDEKHGYLGESVAGAGDIDNDGYDDIIIGADGKRSFTGVAYVIYGGEKSNMKNIDLAKVSLDPATTGFTIKGNYYLDHLGSPVSSACDINNDGYADIIIGAHGKNEKTSRGAAYVIYGGERSTMSNLDFQSMTLDPLTTGFIVEGEENKDFLGLPVSTAGDINKDGYDDILIGVYGKDNGKGAAYVVYGGPKSIMSNIDLSKTTLDPLTTGFIIKGENEGDRFGLVLSSAGDINQDGYADIMIGMDAEWRNHGTVYVIYGGPKANMSNIDLSTTTLNPLTTGFTIKGPTPTDQIGHTMSCAGDINKDGIDDILIGSYTIFSNIPGKAFVIYGRTSGFSDIDLSNSTSFPAASGFMITRPSNAGERFTQSLASIDINNDGFSDLLIADPGTNEFQGSVYLMIFNECPSNCVTCSLTSECTECFDAYGLDDNSQCEACPLNCDICMSSSSCDVCSSGHFISSLTGVGICQSCPLGCIECSDEFTCTVCSSGKYLFQGECFDTCPEATFAGADGITCESCSTGCKQCSSYSVCNVCSSGKYLFQGECMETCPSSTFPGTDGTACQSCSVGCKQCMSDSACEACSSGKYLFQGECLDICPQSMFPRTDGTCQSCFVGCEKCSSDSVCDACSSGKYLFQGECMETCPSSTFPGADGKKCHSCSVGCIQCENDSVCQTCADGFTLSDSKSCIIPQEIPEEKKEEKTSAGVLERTFESMSLIGASLSCGSSLPMNFGMATKILRNVKYLNITVSPELTKEFYSWRVLSGLKSESKGLPGVFSRYGLNPIFLINFWKPFVLSLIGLTIFMIFKSIEIVLTKNNDRKNILYSVSRYVNVAASNFALTQFYSNLDDAVFYFIIEVRYTGFDIFAVILLMLGGIFISLHLKLLNHYQAIKNQRVAGTLSPLEIFVSKCENIRLIMRDFKNNTLLTQSFLLINLIRSMISSLVIAILFDYPLLQVIVLLILNVLMIVYLLTKKPFKELFNTYGQLFCEVILLIANICVFFLAVSEASPILSRCIIALHYILLLGCTLLLVINIGKSFYIAYEDRKSPFVPNNDKNHFEFVHLAEDNLSPDQKNSAIENSNLSNEQEEDQSGC